MKLLTSPSISSSSNASFHTNLCTSKSAAVNCLTGILRRFLCSRSLPTYHDQTTETSSVLCDTSNHRVSKTILASSVSNTPRVVARLMGLESLPAVIPFDQQVGANSVARSQSLNSVELRGDSAQMQGMQGTIPIFLEIENKDFLVLEFEDTAAKSKRSRRCKVRKCEMGVEELEEKRKENRKGSALQSEKKVEEEKITEMVLRVLNEAELRNRITEYNSVNGVGDRGIIEVQPNVRACLKYSCEETLSLHDGKKVRRMELKQVQNGLQLVRKKTKKVNYCELETEEPECGSQDSSPVSVFDFDQFVMDPEPGFTASEKDTKSGAFCSRRIFSTELHNDTHLLQRTGDYSITDDKKTEQMSGKPRERASHTLEYSNTWDETHPQESNSLPRMSWKTEALEDICRDFGKPILDELLAELVHQLCLDC